MKAMGSYGRFWQGGNVGSGKACLLELNVQILASSGQLGGQGHLDHASKTLECSQELS